MEDVSIVKIDTISPTTGMITSLRTMIFSRMTRSRKGILHIG